MSRRSQQRPPTAKRVVAAPHPVVAQVQPLLRAGRIPEALTKCEAAINGGATDLLLLLQTIRLYLHLGKNVEAHALGRRAAELRSDNVDARFQLGLAAMRINRYEEALESFQAVLRLAPGNVEALTNIGAVQFGLGFIPEALAALREALRLAPDIVGIWQNYISMLNYDETVSLDTLMAEHRRAGAKLAALAGPRPEAYPNDTDPERPLRVGYLSGDLFNHPAAHYIEPVLRLHDRERFELFAYSLIGWSDPLTEAFRSHIPNWRDAALVDDEGLFKMIRDDRIDILVDLSGHTARNRVLVVARKPAPITINWIGYLNTMGLDAIDYAVLDPHLLSPAAEAGFVEKPLRLPETAFCYTPLLGARELAPFPRSREGHITFGCFNNPAKLSNPAFSVWTEILKRNPDSRLLFKYKTYTEARVQARVRDAFASRGVDAERLSFEGFTPLGSFLDAFGAIDIALDTFPYTGVTTTMHTLFMGVPLVSLEGDTPMQRFGRTALTAIGRADWIARSPEEYVEIASRLVSEVEANPGLRGDLRARMLASPLMRHDRFIRDLEAGYRRVWARWCADHVG